MSNAIENGRASFAYEKVSKISQKGCKQEYRSLVRSFPVMIQTNGFGASIAFLFSKSKKEAHKALYEDISAWLSKENLINADLMGAVTRQDRDGYKMMTNETMALLLWLKRFAEGMINSETDTKE
ncbi:type III-B CRISPR module-associated protein Cmr5 [Desulfosporosinus shakirovi]|uniref:type III-B CRISPR module-associated protein Cmr5 n=1 Tax=Desulfosporosinus shakirovi TaxID=2885154 RepID=UPI001E2EB3C8|nr:type III-B CRISPR module-associated protein Cmr5 [Desulfosporosinus sp. SRJS8]MCB8818361.1 type III-B CRISPR module-associated protein Cmr5 [Desulfosporosinus sp. SRJS8]